MTKINDFIRTTAVIAFITSGFPAMAEIFTIATTANNIHCDVGDDPETTSLMCTIFERSGPVARAKPADCDRSWGHYYFISRKGPVEMLCLENRSADWPGNAQFQTEETSDFEGVVCNAGPDSLTCHNLDGHGFRLTGPSQTVF